MLKQTVEKKAGRRLLSMALCLMVVLTLMPVMTLAAGIDYGSLTPE